jgi:hypothetical protein
MSSKRVKTLRNSTNVFLALLLAEFAICSSQSNQARSPRASFHARVLSEQNVFGTDVYPLTPQVNWKETGYRTETAGRTALAIALSGMMADGVTTRAEACEIVRQMCYQTLTA